MENQSAALRPLGMGELFDRAIRLYRRHFFKFIGVLAVMQLPYAGLSLIASLATYDFTIESIPSPEAFAAETNPFSLLGADYFSGVFINMLVTVAYLILITGIASAAITNLAADSYLGSELETESPFDAYKAIGDRWPTLVRAVFLYILLTVALLVWTIIPCIGWFTGPGMLLVMAGMVFPLVAPVVVLERLGARASISRTWSLVRNRFWWVFGFMVLLFLFNWVVVGGPSLLAGIALGFLLPDSLAGGDPQMLYNIQVAIQTMISLVFNLLYLPLQLTCLTVLYFDLRVRQEGLDLIAASVEIPEKSLSLRDLVNKPVSKPAEPLIKGRDLLNFSLLSVLLVGLYFVLVLGLATIIMGMGAG